QAMPAQDGVGGERVPTWPRSLRPRIFPFDGHAAALLVIQKDAPFAEFLPKHLVLGSQIFNDLLLLLVDPTSKDEMEQLPGLKNKIHGRPGAMKEDGLASGPGMALSIGRKAFGSAESPRD